MPAPVMAAAAMIDSPLTLLAVAGQTLAIYLALILGLRAIGRRQMAQLTLFDCLIIALLGSAVETGLYRGSASLAAGLVSVTVLLLANRGLSLLAGRVPALRRLLIGRHVLLVHEGRIIQEHLRSGGITKEELMQGIRRRGYDELEDVRFATLEADGRIAVIPREGEDDAQG
jgi:uncharacterized membrane protein YcaP (DUF421 family)